MRKVILSVLFLFVMVGGLLAQTWTKQTVPISGPLNSICAVSTTVCWAVGPSSAIVKTTNGSTWTNAVGNFPAATDLYSVSATSDLNCWVGAGDGSLYQTTNGGTTWTYFPLPAPATAFVDVVHFFTPQIGFVLGDPVGGQWCYYWTTNGGTNWTFGPSPAATGTEAGWNNSYAAIDTAHIWFGTNNSKIYKGSLRGGFTSGPTANVNSFGLAFFDNNTGTAIMTLSTNAVAPNANSTNGGTSWTNSAFSPAATAFGIKTLPNTFYDGYGWLCCAAGTTPGKIYRTTNKGTTWTEQTTTLAATQNFYAISMFNVNCGWAATGNTTAVTNDGIYKYNDVLNAINPINTNTPTSFKLEQNYPNPFNPTTTINYSISKESNVTLKIYDILGMEVKTLVNEKQSVNNYSVNVDFSSLPSGVYYYTLRAGDFTSTKKLMLVK